MQHKGIIIFYMVSLGVAEILSQGCSVSINTDLGTPQPLVLQSNNNFYLPTTKDVISLNDGDVIKVACPGSNLILHGETTTNSIDNAICKNGLFNIGSQTIPFVDITCESYPSHKARYTDKKCLGNFTEIEIGFELSSDVFIRNILICFDESQDNTLYSQFDLTKTISGYQVAFPRPGWLQGTFYSVTGVNTLYSRATQRTTINSLVGLPSTSYKYVAKSGDLYLTRGHLTAKTDFLYGSQHRLTFYFINAVPQWQTFNAVNWGKLEENVRDYASNNGKDLIVYTGTYGATTLKHEETGEDVELYLSYSEGVGKIPVPRLIWKVVYEPISKSAVALVGVNNPYRTTDDLGQDIICNDISDKVTWVTWNRTNLSNGYGYCCTVEDFRKVVKTVPNFVVNALLL